MNHKHGIILSKGLKNICLPQDLYEYYEDSTNKETEYDLLDFSNEELDRLYGLCSRNHKMLSGEQNKKNYRNMGHMGWITRVNPMQKTHYK